MNDFYYADDDIKKPKQKKTAIFNIDECLEELDKDDINGGNETTDDETDVDEEDEEDDDDENDENDENEDDKNVDDNVEELPLEHAVKFEDHTSAFMNKEYEHIIRIIPPDERRTSGILTKFEMTEIVSIRATHISRNLIVYVEIGDLSDPIKMAELELKQRMCPLVLNRTVGVMEDHENKQINYYIEKWNVNEMGFSNLLE